MQLHALQVISLLMLLLLLLYMFCQLSKKHRNGHLPKVDWLDRLTFREIEIINERLKQHSNFLYLMIEFPRFQCNNTEYSVFYFEKVFHFVLFDSITFTQSNIVYHVISIILLFHLLYNMLFCFSYFFC